MYYLNVYRTDIEPTEPTVSDQYEALSSEQSFTPKKSGRPPKVTKVLDLDHELILKEVAVVEQTAVKQLLLKKLQLKAWYQNRKKKESQK